MDNKTIIDLITKLAAPRPQGKRKPGVSGTPTSEGRSSVSGVPAPEGKRPGVPGASAPNKGYSGGTVSSSVRDMQTEIKNFATEVANYSSDMRGRTPAATDQVDGRKSFNDFITEQYLAGSDAKGVEWSKDPARVTKEQKKEHETGLTEMDIVMDSLSRIGNSKSELKIDGVWGFRTNNALLNVYAFATSLVKLSEDFENPSKEFGQNQLKEMYTNLIKEGDPNKVPTADKNQKAEVLTGLIKKLTAFYQRYVKKIAENPFYKRYIDGLTMFTVNPNKQDPAYKTPQEQEMLKHPENLKIGPIMLSGPERKFSMEVILSRLTSTQQLRQLAERLGYPPNVALNPDVQNKILGEIEAHVQSMLSQNKPLAQTSPAPIKPAQTAPRK